jgi:hypothetical protein
MISRHTNNTSLTSKFKTILLLWFIYTICVHILILKTMRNIVISSCFNFLEISFIIWLCLKYYTLFITHHIKQIFIILFIFLDSFIRIMSFYLNGECLFCSWLRHSTIRIINLIFNKFSINHRFPLYWLFYPFILSIFFILIIMQITIM